MLGSDSQTFYRGLGPWNPSLVASGPLALHGVMIRKAATATGGLDLWMLPKSSRIPVLSPPPRAPSPDSSLPRGTPEPPRSPTPTRRPTSSADRPRAPASDPLPPVILPPAAPGIPSVPRTVTPPHAAVPRART